MLSIPEQAIDAAAALEVLHTPSEQMPELMAAANAVRVRHFGHRVQLCSILNAKSGACSEDCAFCAQSIRHRTQASVHPLMSSKAIADAYEAAAALPIEHFGVVASGETLPEAGLERICAAAQSKTIPGKRWCASLGSLELEQLRRLKSAGFSRFHHNLETAESHFPKICTTHTYASRLATVRAAKAAGLEICSGGILGMGESLKQRVEFALTLAREQVDSIPLNFLIAIPGTRLEGIPPLRPLDILRTVAMVRLTNPGAQIKVCAGRGLLGDLQSLIFYAGASGMMIGPLLTVPGRDVDMDLKMLKDLELTLAESPPDV